MGSAGVFFIKKTFCASVQHTLTGFAAGVMTAASVWSLILPAIERSNHMGKLSFLPAVAGFWSGVVFLMLLNRVCPRLFIKSRMLSGTKNRFQKTAMLVFAVTLHNLPEGMAVGVAYAGYMAGDAGITAAAAFTLAMGIAIQNLPEGAIISMPLKAEGIKKSKSFFFGVLSGVIEPIGAVFTILAASLVVPILPFLLSFAAGAMIFVVIKELIPEITKDSNQNIGTVFFSVGFTVMMALDVALG